MGVIIVIYGYKNYSNCCVVYNAFLHAFHLQSMWAVNRGQIVGQEKHSTVTSQSECMEEILESYHCIQGIIIYNIWHKHLVSFDAIAFLLQHFLHLLVGKSDSLRWNSSAQTGRPSLNLSQMHIASTKDQTISSIHHLHTAFDWVVSLAHMTLKIFPRQIDGNSVSLVRRG